MSSPVRATVPAPSSSAKGFSMSAPGHSMSKPSMQRRTFHAGGPGPGSYDPTVGERAIKVRTVARDRGGRRLTQHAQARPHGQRSG